MARQASSKPDSGSPRAAASDFEEATYLTGIHHRGGVISSVLPGQIFGHNIQSLCWN